jgi:hypothetical protein
MALARLLKSTFDRRTHLSVDSLRRAVPIRNPRAQIIAEEDETILIEVPLLETSRGLLKFMAKNAKTPATKRFELETVAAMVWKLCDGKHSFEGISDRLIEKYKMQRVEAESALAAFQQMLAQRRLITLMVKGQK